MDNYGSININNAGSVQDILKSIRDFEVPENWSRKQEEMRILGVNAVEIYDHIIRTTFKNYVIFVDIINGEVYWYNSKRYEESIEGNKIYLNRKSKRHYYLPQLIFDNGEFYPTSRVYLLNGYSESGKKDHKYLSIRFDGIVGKNFIPRVHQIIALFGLGVGTFYALEDKRMLEINHIDGKRKNSRLTNLELVTREQNRQHYEDYLREYTVLKVEF